MKEFEICINEDRQSNMDSENPMEIVNSLNEIIQESAPSVAVEIMRQQVEELSRGIQCDREASETLRGMAVDLQDKLDSASPQGTNFLNIDARDCSPQIVDGQSSGLRSPQGNPSSREREIVKKGIERLEKQILQLINVFISLDQVNITLLKKCKAVDVQAANSVIRNVQKALQKYVGFIGMDSEYCDRIGKLMDKAQAWCLDIEELYNKAEVHSINTSKGDAANVGIFADNS